jgi:hypothetical protein
MGVTYNTSIVRNGLVLHLDAANKKSYPGSGTTWTDLSGNGNNLTLSNSPAYSNLSHFSFNGSNNTTTGEKTAAQMNITDTALSMVLVTRRAASPTNNSQGQIGFSATTLSIKNTTYFFVDVYSTNNTRYIVELTNPRIDRTYFENIWAHFAVTIEGSTVKSFYNGILQTTTTMDGNLKTIQSTQFSVADGYGYYYLQGDISNCMLYNIVLSPSQILQNFNALRGRYGI